MLIENEDPMKNRLWSRLLLIAALATSAAGLSLGSENLIQALEHAEKSRDLKGIEKVYAKDAVLLHPDGLPVCGIEAIHALYEFIWSRTPSATTSYSVDSTFTLGDQRIEIGFSEVVIEGGKNQRTMYKATFAPTQNGHHIIKIEFDERVISQNKLPKMAPPTGELSVGRSVKYYQESKTGYGRPLSFELWYPAQPGPAPRALYQSRDVVEASAQFLRWPLFFNSYFSVMQSNAFTDAKVLPGGPFPVLLYNHGYGGFTSVYQMMCEELASFGYIVVSIGHEHESALLIKNDGGIIPTDPANEFYTARAAELNGERVNELQSVILNSDDTMENLNAYKELIKLSPLHNQSTRLWASDSKEAMIKLAELNKNGRFKNAFDLNAVGVFGHSVGGATAGQMAMDTSLVKAGLNLDGFQFGDLVNGELAVPFMFVSSNRDGDSSLRATSFLKKSKSAGYQAVVKGFSHGSFTDLEYFNPGGVAAINVQRDLIRTFFDLHLRGRDVDFKSLQEKYDNLAIVSH
jgi:dienelactone hydrolase/ketosteroid isomerase-like protein